LGRKGRRGDPRRANAKAKQAVRCVGGDCFRWHWSLGVWVEQLQQDAGHTGGDNNGGDNVGGDRRTA
jgi:hypothetical protein